MTLHGFRRAGLGDGARTRCALLVLTTLTTVPVTAGESVIFRRGDANGDGSVNILDALTITSSRFKGGSIPWCDAAADANSSGSVDVSDAVHILNFSFRDGPAPGHPFPDCGFAETQTCESFPSSACGISIAFDDDFRFAFELTDDTEGGLVEAAAGSVVSVDTKVRLRVPSDSSAAGWNFRLRAQSAVASLGCEFDEDATTTDGTVSASTEDGGLRIGEDDDDSFERVEVTLDDGDSLIRSAIVLDSTGESVLLPPLTSATPAIVLDTALTLEVPSDGTCHVCELSFDPPSGEGSLRRSPNAVIGSEGSIVPRTLSRNIFACPPPEPLSDDEPKVVTFGLDRKQTCGLFRFTGEVGDVLCLTMSSFGAGADVFVAWGRVPTPTDFDFVANDTNSPFLKRLVIPGVRDQTGFVLVKGLFDEFAGDSATSTVVIRQGDSAIESANIGSRLAQGGGLLSTTVRGAGFEPHTTFFLRTSPFGKFFQEAGGAGGGVPPFDTTIVRPAVTDRVSSTRIDVSFDLTGVPPGEYDLVMQDVPESPCTVIARAFDVTAPIPVDDVDGDAQLDVRLIAEGRYKKDRIRNAVLEFSNRGGAPMPAPFFRLRAFRQQFRPDGTAEPPQPFPIRFCFENDTEACSSCEGAPDMDNELLILGIDPETRAGELQPGATVGIPIVLRLCDLDGSPDEQTCFASFNTEDQLNFPCSQTVFTVEQFLPPANARVPWEDVATPPGFSEADGDSLRAELETKLGTTFAEVANSLADFSTHVARRGYYPADVETIIDEIAKDALDLPTASITGSVTNLAALRVEGIVIPETFTILAFIGRELVCVTETDERGDFVLSDLEAGRYRLEVHGKRLRTPVNVRVEEDERASAFGITVIGDSDPFGGGPGPVPNPTPRTSVEAAESVTVMFPDPFFTVLFDTATSSVQSIDPNEKEGEDGESEEIVFEDLDGDPTTPSDRVVHAVRGQPVDFTIRFENTCPNPNPTGQPPSCPEGSLTSADKVVVTDVLSEHFDISTVQFGDAGYGSTTFCFGTSTTTSGGVTECFCDATGGVHYETEGARVVKVDASLDVSTRTLKWEFTCLTSCGEGFLPPNRCDDPAPGCMGNDDDMLDPGEETGDGEGYVRFRVLPIPSTPDDTLIVNDAEINFDDISFLTTPPSYTRLVDQLSDPDNPDPKDGEEDVSTGKILSWGTESSTEADQWEVKVWESTEPEPTEAQATIDDTDGLSRIYFKPTDLDEDKTYNWKVENTGDSGSGGDGGGGGRSGRLVAEWSFSTEFGPSDRFVRGDVNADGVINVTDSMITVAHLLLGGPPPTCMAAANVNSDRRLDIADPIFTLRWLFRGGAAPPTPTPSDRAYDPADCGEAPGSEEFACASFPPCD